MLARSVAFIRNSSGSSAVEFALVIPVFLLLTLGTINMSFVLYAASTLHSTVEDAARCASIRASSTCPTTTDTEAYATSMYRGPGIGAVFDATVDLTCGQRVTGTGTYTVNLGVGAMTIPLSATACYP